MKRMLIAALALLLAITSCNKNPVAPEDNWNRMWIYVPNSTWTDQYVYFRYEGDPENGFGIYRTPITGQGLPELVVLGMAFAAVSPCGNKLVYGANGRPWLKTLDSTNVADGTAVPLEADPQDQSRLFGWLGCDTILYEGRTGLCIYDLTTGKYKRELYPSFSAYPTGSRNGVISFLGLVGPAPAIFTIHHEQLDTVAVFPDTLAAPSIAWPSISPDARRILFGQEAVCERWKEDSMLFCTSINIIDVTTGAITTVDSGSLPKAVHHPTWAAGGQVVYVGSQGDRSQLWIGDTLGKKRVLLTREHLIDGLKKRKDFRS